MSIYQGKTHLINLQIKMKIGFNEHVFFCFLFLPFSSFFKFQSNTHTHTHTHRDYLSLSLSLSLSLYIYIYIYIYIYNLKWGWLNTRSSQFWWHLFHYTSLSCQHSPKTLQALNTPQPQPDKYIFIDHLLTAVLSFWNGNLPPKMLSYFCIVILVSFLTVYVFA